MTNVVDQSAWWNPLLSSAIFTWLGGIKKKQKKKEEREVKLVYD